MIFRIYKLVDPRNNEIRYIGCTNQSLRARLAGIIGENELEAAFRASHPRPASYFERRGFCIARLDWWTSLAADGVRPNIELLREIDCEPVVASAIEQDEIQAHRRAGHPLVNAARSPVYPRVQRGTARQADKKQAQEIADRLSLIRSTLDLSAFEVARMTGRSEQQIECVGRSPDTAKHFWIDVLAHKTGIRAEWIRTGEKPVRASEKAVP